jgi:hypothetical protein
MATPRRTYFNANTTKIGLHDWHTLAKKRARDSDIRRWDHVQLGLISAGDPLLERLKRPPPGIGQAPPASGPPSH